MKRTVLSVVMLLGLLISPAYAAAQPTSRDTAFTTEYSGLEIDLGNSGDLAFDPEEYSTSEFDGGSEEFVWAGTQWSNFQLIFVEGNNNSEYYMDVTLENQNEFYDSFELLDSDVTDEDGWFVASAELDGFELVVSYFFTLDAYGDTDFALMQFGSADAFVEDMEIAQSEITIDGEPILADVDTQDIADLLPAGDLTDEDDAETTPASDDEDVETTPDAGDDGEEGSDGILDPYEPDSTPGGISFPIDDIDEDGTPDIGTGDGTEEDVSDDSTAEAAEGDWDSMGLVSETEWVSPNYDISVTWDDATWLFPEDYEYAIFLGEDPIYDSLTLETVDGLGYVFVTVEEADGTTPDSQVEFWESPDYAERFEGEFEVVESSSTADTAAIVYETVNNADQPLYVVLTATFMDDGTIVYSQVSAAPETIQDVYGQYVDGVEFDGGPLNMTYTVDDIIEMAGN